MALNSYLPDEAGALVAAGAFDDAAAAIGAVRALRDVGLRPLDISVLCDEAGVARRIAAEGAYAPRRSRFPFAFRGGLPREVRARYGKALGAGKIVIVAASDGQPADTLATVLERVAKASDVAVWWQEPTAIFAPAEQGGPL